jgi:hypothetical protein
VSATVYSVPRPLVLTGSTIKPDSVPSIEVDDSLGLDDRKTEDEIGVDEIPFT